MPSQTLVKHAHYGDINYRSAYIIYLYIHIHNSPPPNVPCSHWQSEFVSDWVWLYTEILSLPHETASNETFKYLCSQSCLPPPLGCAAMWAQGTPPLSFSSTMSSLVSLGSLSQSSNQWRRRWKGTPLKLAPLHPGITSKFTSFGKSWIHEEKRIFQSPLLTHTSRYEELFPKSLRDLISQGNLIKFIDLIGRSDPKRRLVGWNSLRNGNNPRVWPCIGETVAGHASVPASLNPRHSHKSFDQVEGKWCICDYVLTLNP